LPSARTADDGEAEAIKPSEGGQVGPAEAGRRGSVGHVEVFQMVSMRTSIFGRPDSYRGTDAPAGRSRDHPQRSQNRCDAAYGQDGGAPFDQIGYGARIREDEIVGET
jgi:hypothetical protein